MEGERQRDTERLELQSEGHSGWRRAVLFWKGVQESLVCGLGLKVCESAQGKEVPGEKRRVKQVAKEPPPSPAERTWIPSRGLSCCSVTCRNSL